MLNQIVGVLLVSGFVMFVCGGLLVDADDVDQAIGRALHGHP